MTLVDPNLISNEALVERLGGVPAGQRIVLVIHDDHFTEELATYLATKPQAIYRDIDVRFSAGQVEVQGRIRVLGVWMPATAWGNLLAQDCQVEATITDLSVGGSLTPAFVREQARKLIYGELEKALDELFKTLPICLESIEVLEGVAIAEGAKQQVEP